MFIRRLYYNLQKGNVLCGYSVETLIEEDPPKMGAEILCPDMNPEDVGIMEWTAPNETVEQYFNGNYDVSVNVSVTPHELVFTERQEATNEDTEE